MMKIMIWSILGALIISAPVYSQQIEGATEQDKEYINVLYGRADKIVKPLEIADPSKEDKVRTMIVQQYFDLSKVHDQRDEAIETAREKYAENESKSRKRVDKIKNKAQKQLNKLNDQYLSQLGDELSPTQVDQVKDGMTYGVLPLTYRGYLNLLPELTDSQKKKIMTLLTEARELAMTGGSSEEKHAWFGKYKGKINNFLSAEGYDLKQAEKQLHKKNKENSAKN